MTGTVILKVLGGERVIYTFLPSHGRCSVVRKVFRGTEGLTDHVTLYVDCPW